MSDMSGKPVLRELYDRIAQELGPQLSGMTASDRFAVAVDVAEAVRQRTSTELQRSSRRFLHACNLPAGSDITVLRDEIGALDRAVRALARQVETLQQQLDDERRQRPAKSATGPRRRAS
jgi:ribosome-associated translation inhibitor RaiA